MLRELHLRPAVAEVFSHGKPVAVVKAAIVETAAILSGGEGADGAEAFGPEGSVVCFEEAF